MPLGCYERPFIDYPGQEQFGAAKRRNQVLLARTLSGTVVAPGEVFSIWRLSPWPTDARGYASAAALKNREMTSEAGGRSACFRPCSTTLRSLAGWRSFRAALSQRRFLRIAALLRTRVATPRSNMATSTCASEPAPYPVLLSIDVNESARGSTIVCAHRTFVPAFRC